MNWYDAVHAPGLVAAPSPAESARFDLSIDRMTVSAASETTLGGLVDAVEATSADVVILRYPADRVTWFASLATMTGRLALLADSLVYWRLPVGTGRWPRWLPSVQVERHADPETVDSLIAETFAEYGNHYLANPLFDPALALAGYQEWARTAVESGDALVLRGSVRRDDPPTTLALTTMSIGPDHVESVLSCVLPAAERRGLYAKLLAVTEERAADLRAAQVVLSTQGHHIKVQRAWAWFGFEPVHTMFTVHLVRPGLLPERLRTDRTTSSAR